MLKINLFRLTFLLLCVFLWVGCGGKPKKIDESRPTDCKSCHQFKTQTQLKKYLKTRPECRQVLDADNDGKYCESLKK